MTTIQVTLTGEAEKYYHDLRYSLDGKKGSATHNECINHALVELKLFEDFHGDQVTSWIMDNYPKEYKEWREKFLSKELSEGK